MEKAFSKMSVARCLLAVLLVGAALSLALAPPVAAATEQVAPEIRQPAEGGDLEAFWNGLAWSDLTPAERDLWKVLGWDEASWEGEGAEPPSESKAWSELSDEERRAAERLGYDAKPWDSAP